MPLPINVVPAKALGDEFAVAPVGLQVAPIVRDTHRPVAEYLQENSSLYMRGHATILSMIYAICCTRYCTITSSRFALSRSPPSCP